VTILRGSVTAERSAKNVCVAVPSLAHLVGFWTGWCWFVVRKKYY